MFHGEITDASRIANEEFPSIGELSSQLWSESRALSRFETMQSALTDKNTMKEFGDLLIFEDDSRFAQESTERTRIVPQNLGVSTGFYNAMKKELDVVPVEIQNYVLDRLGTKVVFATTYSRVDTMYSDVNARSEGGTPQEYKDLPGAFVTSKNTVVIPEFKEGPDGKPERNPVGIRDLGATARHEFGHAVDAALAEKIPTKDGRQEVPDDEQRFSNQEKFVTAYEKDAKDAVAHYEQLTYNDKDKLRYYMPDPRESPNSEGNMKARREIFAEMFAMICEETSNVNGYKMSESRKYRAELLKKEFPETYKVVKSAVEDLMKQGVKNA